MTGLQELIQSEERYLNALRSLEENRLDFSDPRPWAEAAERNKAREVMA